MLRQDNCQASLHNTISSKCPTEKAVGSMCAGQTRREEEAEKSGDNMWHHSESRALRRSTFVARSQPDVPSVSKQEWLREGNFQQFVRF